MSSGSEHHRIVCIIEARMRSTPAAGQGPAGGRGRAAAGAHGRAAASLPAPRRDRHRDHRGPVVRSASRRSPTTSGSAVFRGSEDDVLARVLGAAQASGADVIVETTGDCPLIDPHWLDLVVDAYLRDGGCDFCSNTLTETFPRGIDVRVFSTAALAEVAATTNDPADREHVSLYFWTHPERYHLREVKSPEPSLGDLRLTVDTPEDLGARAGHLRAPVPAATTASASARSPRCCASTPRSGRSTRTSSRRPSRPSDAGGGHRLRAHRLGAGRDRARARRAEPRGRLRRLGAHRAGGGLRRRPRPGHARGRAVGRAGLRGRRRPAAQRPPGGRGGRHARRDARGGGAGGARPRPGCAARWSRSRSRSTRPRRRRWWRWRSARASRSRCTTRAARRRRTSSWPGASSRARWGTCSTCRASTPPASPTTARTGSTSCACWRARSRGSRRPTGWGRVATTRPSTWRSASPAARAAAWPACRGRRTRRSSSTSWARPAGRG